MWIGNNDFNFKLITKAADLRIIFIDRPVNNITEKAGCKASDRHKVAALIIVTGMLLLLYN
jgi:hypothetical protein